MPSHLGVIMTKRLCACQALESTVSNPAAPSSPNAKNRGHFETSEETVQRLPDYALAAEPRRLTSGGQGKSDNWSRPEQQIPLRAELRMCGGIVLPFETLAVLPSVN
ncbi:hypothetical protein PV08_06594 [Exophiala spinifera]|uniref:Uncharacterized protein n=1 Tax=Exophiala spinifera TaxID=91928 RepID=A0A0D2BRC7_9EURO|nr:uncharacterized protein PV08_06594 [Exophiala spinifera]KIW13814.1 hypothetical protein PV08_06594 [Exophiala spinifera]